MVFHRHFDLEILINFEQGALIFILPWALQTMYWPQLDKINVKGSIST